MVITLFAFGACTSLSCGVPSELATCSCSLLSPLAVGQEHGYGGLLFKNSSLQHGALVCCKLTNKLLNKHSVYSRVCW